MKAKEKAMEHILLSRKVEVFYPFDDISTALSVSISEAIDIALEEQAKENYEFLWGLLSQSLYDNNKPLFYKIDDEMKRLKAKANTRGHKDERRNYSL